MVLHEDVSLDALLDKSQHASEKQAKEIESIQSADTVNLLNSYKPDRKWQPTQINPEGTCHMCEYLWPHKDGQSQAKGHTCSKCGKTNHFLKFFFQSATNHRVQTKDLSHCSNTSISIVLMFIMLYHQSHAKRMTIAVMNIYIP